MTLRHALAAALTLSLALPSAAQDQPRDFTPVEFTISGGISLGNYEAGLNWAVVRLIKLHEHDATLLKGLPPPKMVAVTGASAGNINALIAAIEWCRADEGGASPLGNAFYQSWIPVGWDGLFAGDRTCVQYCHDRHLESTWAARLGGGGEDPCVTACEKDCTQFGGSDCKDDGGAAYRADDAVFTRRAFLGVEESFRAAIEKAKYDPACKLAVGITTTKFHPTLLDVTGPPPTDTEKRAEPPHYVPQPYQVSQDGLTIETQRYVTSLRAETRDRQFGYYEHSFQDDHTLGSYLHLPKVPSTDNRVAVDDVLSLTEASSAFPLAFGPRKLRFCKVTEKPTAAGEECVENETLTYDWFIDGGAFDNVPLGLGYSLTEAMVDRIGGVTTKDRHFFYIDPDRRRYLSENADPTGANTTSPQPVYPSLSEVANLAGNFYAVAGKYELQTVARYVWRESPSQQPPRLLIAGRLTPIVGEYLYAFGAYLAQPFRTFDYEVGIYDGAYDYARWVCDQEAYVANGTPARSRPRCMLQALESTYAELGLNRPDAAEPRYVFQSLLDREFRTWSRISEGEDAKELQALATEAADWSKSQGFDAAKPPNVAVGALMRAVGELHDEEVDAAAGGPDAKAKAELVEQHRGDFAYFLKLLGPGALEGYSQEERELLADPEAFTNRALLSILSRERQIEHQQNNGTTTRALIAAQVAVLSQQSSKTLGLEVDPSSIPDDNLLTVGKVIGRIIPYRFNYRRPAYAPPVGFNLFGSRWDRLELGWEPTLGVIPDLALILPIGAYWQLNPASVGGFVTPGLLWRTHQPLFAGADLGIKASKGLFGVQDYDAVFHLGAEVGVRILGGKVRLSVAMDDFENRVVTFGFGLLDLNGMLYWGVRIIEGK